jgi:hypothetical protein
MSLYIFDWWICMIVSRGDVRRYIKSRKLGQRSRFPHREYIFFCCRSAPDRVTKMVRSVTLFFLSCLTRFWRDWYAPKCHRMHLDCSFECALPDCDGCSWTTDSAEGLFLCIPVPLIFLIMCIYHSNQLVRDRKVSRKECRLPFLDHTNSQKFFTRLNITNVFS